MGGDDRVLPGFANVHSHAFQRGLRGAAQHREPHRADSFWGWRHAMYNLAGSLDLQRLEDLSRLCFVECLEAGFTAVGEFHYLHHGPGGQPYDDPLAASHAVLRAARQSGIRITLLWTLYGASSFGAPPTREQRRFSSSGLDELRSALDGLQRVASGPREAVGLALHSVRAVPRAWLGPAASAARARGLPIHVHASEQPSEVIACRSATGLTPIGLLDSEGVLGPDVTLIHATWLERDDLERIGKSGASVCICPSTEGDLGDGVPPTAELHERGVRLCIGSDSHAAIDPLGELRTLEYQARAASGRRAVLADASGQVTPELLRIGHHNGYAALGLDSTGDRVFLDPSARALQETGPHWRAAAWTAGHPGLIDRVHVDGMCLVEGGRHLDRPHPVSSAQVARGATAPAPSSDPAPAPKPTPRG